MIRTEFEWHPHTETPSFNRASAVIAIPASSKSAEPGDDVAVLLGIFEWVDGKWDETDWSVALPEGPFYWALEIDIVGTIPAFHASKNEVCDGDL